MFVRFQAREDIPGVTRVAPCTQIAQVVLNKPALNGAEEPSMVTLRCSPEARALEAPLHLKREDRPDLPVALLGEGDG